MDKYLIIVLTALLIGACNNTTRTSYDMQAAPVVGFSTPLQLHPGTDTLFVRDYIIDLNKIDSLQAPQSLNASFSSDKKYVVVKETLSKPMANLVFWIDGKSYAVPLFQAREKKATLTFNPDKKYSEVSVRGEMNNWNADEGPMQLKNGKWQVSWKLRPGRYEYHLVVDGKEILDPGNEHTVPNGLGWKNSVLIVTGPNRESLPWIQTVSFTSEQIKLLSTHASDVYVYWQNTLIEAKMKKNRIIIPIPEQAKNHERSFIRVWAYNDVAYSNDLLIPLENGKVVTSVNQLERSDWERTVMYFMMVDRFKNGNPANDEKVDDPDILPMANYFGGDLAGITQKMKDGYFEMLGVNALWISPITQNPKGAYGLFPDPRTQFSGYHGYWPISSSEVDYRFGTEKELRTLLQTAHEHGMNVILDYVANHVHELHPVYQEHPEWFNSMYLPNGEKNLRNWDTHRLTTWFDTFMPDLDFSNPKVVSVMTDSAVYWLTNYSFDGFRHDATKHVPLQFWRTLTKKLKKQVVIPQDQRIYQIGETYGSRALIASYITTGMVDGQFDFNVYDDAVAAFTRDDVSMKRLSNSLQASLEYYGYHNLMGYISGNHDRPRFISYAGGALKFSENAKEAGWKRDIGVGDPVGYKKLRMLMAFNMTIPGIPVIYYGDEIGMPGGGDPDNRRMMRFNNLKPRELKTWKITAKLVHLRTQRLSLIYGGYHHLMADEKNYAYCRNYFNEWTFVFFNKADSPKTVTIEIPIGFSDQPLEAKFGNSFSVAEDKIKVKLEPYSFEILTTPKI